MSFDRPLENCRLLMFIDQDYEDLEVWYPKLRMVEAGAHVTLAGPKPGVNYRGKHGYPALSDGLIVPGGWAPDKLRRDPHVLKLTRDFHAAGKLIAAVCHGGWVPISADVYKGVRVTGSPGIKDDLINSGAQWEDAAVVVDRHFVCSRKPDDLPEFCRGILKVMVK